MRGYIADEEASGRHMFVCVVTVHNVAGYNDCK